VAQKLNSKNTLPKAHSWRAVFIAAACLVGGFGLAHWAGQTYSANLTSVSVTTTNSRPSFRGALAAGNTAGSSIITINTTPGSYASSSSAQLVEGDVLRIGSAGTLRSYTVASTSSLSVINLTAALLAGDADTGDDVIATSSATLNARFTTVSAVTDGTFRILVPSISGGASLDGIPDGGAFDYGTVTPTVTCPADFTGYNFGAGTSTANDVTINGIAYHSYSCTYVGAGAVSTAFDGTTHDYMSIAGMLNPAPTTGHTTGTADTYSVIVQHLDSGSNVIDSTTVKIGVVEAVKVTAYVAPQISFRLIGLPAATSACGASTSVATTAVSVPFGDLTIGVFKTAAQALSVSTNASGGYVVTAVENDQLGRNGTACTGDPTTASNGNCIQDVRGDAAAASDTVSDEWVSTSQPGFGYSLQDVNSTVTEAFAYNESARTFSARQFADVENSGTPQTIFSDTTVAANDNLYVCYKIMPDATTAAGNYENYLTYTATATF
jgi:hypothetical protein